MTSVKGRVPGAVLNEEEMVIPDGSFLPPNLDLLDSEPASTSVSERDPYLHLSSLIISPPSSSSSLLLEVLAAISSRFCRSSMLCPGRHHRVSLVCPHGGSGFASNPKPWIPSLTTGITDHHWWEQESGHLSYLHHLVLVLDEIDCLVHTVTEELGTRGLTTPFLSSSHALNVNSSRVRRVIQAFLRTCVSFPAPDASAHGMMRPGLLRPYNLSCTSDGVSPESYVSLGLMPSRASPLGSGHVRGVE